MTQKEKIDNNYTKASEDFTWLHHHDIIHALPNEIDKSYTQLQFGKRKVWRSQKGLVFNCDVATYEKQAKCHTGVH